MIELAYKYSIVLLFFTLGFISECRCQANLDSLLNEQVKATRGVCREVRDLKVTLETKLTEINNTEIESNNKIDESSRMVSDSISALKVLGIGNEGSSTEEYAAFFSRLLSALVGALVGVLGAIAIFNRQLKSDKELAKDVKLKEDKAKMHFLNSLLASAISASENFVDGVKEFHSVINPESMEYPNLNIVSIQDIKRLSNTLGDESYYQAYISIFGDSEKNVNEYRTLSNNIDFLSDQINQIIDSSQIILVAHTERKKKYAKLFESFHNRMMRLGSTHEKYNTGISQNLHVEISSIALAHSNGIMQNPSSQGKIEYCQASFVSPLVSAFTGKYSQLSGFEYHILDLKNLTNIFNEIPLQLMHHSAELHSQLPSIEAVNSKLRKEDLIRTQIKRS